MPATTACAASSAGSSAATGEAASTSLTAAAAKSRHGARQAATRSPSPGTDCAPLIISVSTRTCPASRSASNTLLADVISSASVPVLSSSSRYAAIRRALTSSSAATSRSLTEPKW